VGGEIKELMNQSPNMIQRKWCTFSYSKEQNLDSQKEKKLSIQIEKKENSLFVLKALH
jgi:hypothetical protein